MYSKKSYMIMICEYMICGYMICGYMIYLI